MPYAILRFEKLKSTGAISTAQKHNERERETPNADKEIENIVIHGEKEKTYLESFKEVTKDIKIRKNAVYAIECFMSVSPETEFLRDEEKVIEWAKKSVEWLKENFGEQNIIKSHLHLDEKTPHLHTFIIPIKDKKLNSFYYLGGSRNRLSEYQTNYHNKVAEFGLERGLKGSQAKHFDLKKFYSLVNDVIDKELPKTKLLETSNKYRERVMDEYKKLYAKCMDLELKNESLEKRVAGKVKITKELIAIKDVLDDDKELKDYIMVRYKEKKKTLKKQPEKESIKDTLAKIKTREKIENFRRTHQNKNRSPEK